MLNLQAEHTESLIRGMKRESKTTSSASTLYITAVDTGTVKTVAVNDKSTKTRGKHGDCAVLGFDDMDDDHGQG
jgi:hypothetical protein